MIRLVQGIFLAVAAVVLLWLGGFLLFSAQLPRQPVAHANVSDAIVVLTGGQGRLQVGLHLLSAGKGGKLLVSGVKTGISAAELQANSTATSDLFSCCVDLGYQAHDTWGNAIEAALWIRRHGFQSLHLVTASYHMPRSLLLFQQAMPKVSLQANPVFSERVKLANWWRFPGTMKLLAVEYSKYLVSLLRVRLTGPAG
ncbi:MAG: YdcF family protein [Alphaproteobacteria bacterium]|nr:YdcF family protein [Alphaproteobacteria bacterium]MDP6876240.1 YdcF family protein [Alphaproteobacteria bacterium]